MDLSFLQVLQENIFSSKGGSHILSTSIYSEVDMGPVEMLFPSHIGQSLQIFPIENPFLSGSATLLLQNKITVKAGCAGRVGMTKAGIASN